MSFWRQAGLWFLGLLGICYLGQQGVANWDEHLKRPSALQPRLRGMLERIRQDGDGVINGMTIGDEDLWREMQSWTIKEVVVKQTRAAVNATAMELDVTSTMGSAPTSVFGNEASQFLLAVFLTEKKSLGAVVRGRFEGAFAFPYEALMAHETSSWMKDVKFSGGALLAVASEQRDVWIDQHGESYGRDVTLQANMVVLGGSTSFGLNRLTGLPTNQLGASLSARLALNGHVDSDLNKAILSIDESIAIDLAPVEHVASSGKVRMLINGMSKQPALTLAFVLATRFNDNAPVQFEMYGDWHPRAKLVKLSGGLGSPWAHPFGARCLIVQSAWLLSRLQIGSAGKSHRLSSNSIVKGTVLVGIAPARTQTVSFTGAAYGGAIGIKLSVTVMVPMVEFVHQMTGGLNERSVRVLSDILFVNGKADIKLASETMLTSGFIAGLNVNAVINLNCSAGTSMAVLGRGGDIIEQVSAVLYVPKPATVPTTLKLTAVNIPLSIASRLTTIDLSVAVGPSSESCVCEVILAAKLLLAIGDSVTVPGVDALAIDVQSSWNCSAESASIDGVVVPGSKLSSRLSWVVFKSAEIRAALTSRYGLQSISVHGLAQLVSATEPLVYADVLFTADHDEADTYSVTLVFSETVPISRVVRSILSGLSKPEAIGDLVTDDIKLISSSSNRTVTVKLVVALSGISIDVDGVGLVAGSATHDLMKSLIRADLDPCFALAIFIPFISTKPFSVRLTLDHLVVRPTLILEDVALELDLHCLQPSIGVMASVKVQLNLARSDWVNFVGAGTIGLTGVDLKGGALGPWESVFGVRGVELESVWFEIGFTPVVGLTSIGAGGIMNIGTTSATLEGMVDLAVIQTTPAQDPFDIFLYAMVEKLTLRNLCESYNRAQPNAHIDLNRIPSAFAFTELMVKIAPFAGHVAIDDHTFIEFDNRGLAFETDVSLLGMVSVTLGAHADFGPAAFDWGFHCHFARIHHSTWIQSFAGPNWYRLSRSFQKTPERLSHFFPVLQSFVVDEFSTANIQKGVLPRLTFTFEVFGKLHSFSISIRLAHLLLPFHQLFALEAVDLKTSLALPSDTCVVNSDCGDTGRRCIHREGAWVCADTCSARSRNADIAHVGCFEV